MGSVPGIKIDWIGIPGEYFAKFSVAGMIFESIDHCNLDTFRRYIDLLAENRDNSIHVLYWTPLFWNDSVLIS